VSNNAGNKALLMLGSATATLVMNYLLTNHLDSSNHHHDNQPLPKTKTTEPLKDTERNEMVMRTQAINISRLRQDNENLKGQLEAVSDYLETCEAEVLKIDRQLETVRHSSKPNGHPSQPTSHHNDEPKLTQEEVREQLL
jgi:predicted RNase H-like nuclease (RuvC/YqgF family)